MSNPNEQKPLNREQYWDELTSQNSRKPFEEYPKCLYHPDGRSLVVASRAEQDATGGDWLESPQEAIDVREGRDKRESEKFVAKVGAEAAATRGKPKN